MRKLGSLKYKIPVKKNKKHMKTIIFDLDETLVHCKPSIEGTYDAVLDVDFPDWKIEVAVNIRPYCRELLASVSRFFEVGIFTASHKAYASKVIDYLDHRQ